MAVKALTDWFGERRVAVEAVYLASKLNVEADEESRTEADACVGGWIWQSLHSLVGLGHLMLICWPTLGIRNCLLWFPRDRNRELWQQMRWLWIGAGCKVTPSSFAWFSFVSTKSGVKKLLSFLFPSLDWPTLVSTLAGTIVRNSLDITFKPNVFDIHSGGGALSVSFQRSTPGRLESLRRILKERRVSPQLDGLLVVGRHPNRNAAYESVLHNWMHWWMGRHKNPMFEFLMD